MITIIMEKKIISNFPMGRTQKL